MLIKCLALIIYMEARGESELTQEMVAKVAIDRSIRENLSICESLKKPKNYSWQWDGISTKIEPKTMAKVEVIARKALKLNKLTGRIYFNHCKLGKRFKTEFKMIKSGNLCFY